MEDRMKQFLALTSLVGGPLPTLQGVAIAP
jgi:hypothetical protein